MLHKIGSQHVANKRNRKNSVKSRLFGFDDFIEDEDEAEEESIQIDKE